MLCAPASASHLHHLNLCTYPLLHFSRVTDYTYFLTLHGVQTRQGINHQVQATAVQGPETFIHEQVAHRNVAGGQRRQAQCQCQTDQKGLSSRQGTDVTYLIAPVMVDDTDSQRIGYLFQTVPAIQQTKLFIGPSSQCGTDTGLSGGVDCEGERLPKLEGTE